jgi:hypothetical protein
LPFGVLPSRLLLLVLILLSSEYVSIAFRRSALPAQAPKAKKEKVSRNTVTLRRFPY